MLNILKNEPARVVAAVLALIGLATAFGLGITDGQQSAIVAAVMSGLALLGGEAVRAQVTPTAKIGDQSIAAAPAPVADAPAPAPAAPVADAPAPPAE
jgi:hypothetical protein